MQVRSADLIPVDKNCFGWMAVNKGDGLAVVDGIELKGFIPGHPELSGESTAVVHPLALPFIKPQLQVSFQGASSVTQVQLIFLINY